MPESIPGVPDLWQTQPATSIPPLSEREVYSDAVPPPLLPYDEERHHALYESDNVSPLAEPFLAPTLAKDERTRLLTLWYLTAALLDEGKTLSLLDRISQLVQRLLGWETAFVSIVDQHDFICIASVDFPIARLHRYESFCAHAILARPESVFQVPDIDNDYRFANHPLRKANKLRAYCGTPRVSLRLPCEEELMPCQYGSESATQTWPSDLSAPQTLVQRVCRQCHSAAVLIPVHLQNR
jgi:hypothetical protein